MTEISTRIKLRYDELGNWLDENALSLLKGEVAIIKCPDGSVRTKFGDGENAISALPYANACFAKMHYVDISNLIDNRQLVPGIVYCIDDYSASVNPDSGYDVAGTTLSVYAIAATTSSFIEDATAFDADGNQYDVKYCFANDTTRFTWANENGKGVIYSMKDADGNEAPYDFKGIQFKVNEQFYLTFSGDGNFIGNKIAATGSDIMKNVISCSDGNECANNTIGYGSTGIFIINSSNVAVDNNCTNISCEFCDNIAIDANNANIVLSCERANLDSKLQNVHVLAATNVANDVKAISADGCDKNYLTVCQNANIVVMSV